MLNVVGKWVGILSLLAGFAAAESASAFFFGHGHDHDDDDDIRVTEMRAGPADYHKVYGSIANTVVTIEDFFLRTNDGNVYKVATDYMTVDLQDLSKFGRGLLIDTRKIKNWPRNQTELKVVEIETKIVSNIKGREAYILWGRGGTQYDNGKCMLRSPKFLNFYTQPSNPEGIPMEKDEYLVKVDFSPLNAIQIDIITQTKQKVNCDCDDDCKKVGRPQVKKIMRCEIANRRNSINRVIPKRNEF